jgi:beta-glucosidase
MKSKLFFRTAMVVMGFLVACTPKTKAPADLEMKVFIDDLMGKMTLEEKIGQLNLPGSGDIVTGQTSSSDIGQKIKEGQVGGLFNIKSVEKIRDVQKVAVEESRLKIPLIFGMDVIHGYQTTFPIPLGLASSFDMSLIEKAPGLPPPRPVPTGFAGLFHPWSTLPVIRAGDALPKGQGRTLISARV